MSHGRSHRDKTGKSPPGERYVVHDGVCVPETGKYYFLRRTIFASGGTLCRVFWIRDYTHTKVSLAGGMGGSLKEGPTSSGDSPPQNVLLFLRQPFLPRPQSVAPAWQISLPERSPGPRVIPLPVFSRFP